MRRSISNVLDERTAALEKADLNFNKKMNNNLDMIMEEDMSDSEHFDEHLGANDPKILTNVASKNNEIEHKKVLAQRNTGGRNTMERASGYRGTF